MKYIDLHADTLYELKKARSFQWQSNQNHIDLEKLERGNSFIQCLAVFNSAEEVGSLYKATRETCDFAKELIDRTDHTEFIGRYEDINRNEAKGTRSLMLTLEDAGGLEGKIGRIEEFYNLGIRMMSLTWNFENCLAYPNSEDPLVMNSGLKGFGHEAIEVMNDLGVIIDVSHLSDAGVRDVISSSTRPVIASHSNARGVCDHQRNLPDDIIRMIAEKGGVLGINFYNLFLSADCHSSLENLGRHIEHIRNVGGAGCLSIGTDFDGFEDDGRMDIKNAGEMGKLWDYLGSRGFLIEDIESLAWKNADRLFRDIL